MLVFAYMDGICLCVIVHIQVHKAQGAKKNNSKKSSDNNKDDEDVVDYGKAGAITEEVLSAIRIVTSFGGQNEIVEWYVHINNIIAKVNTYIYILQSISKYAKY